MDDDLNLTEDISDVEEEVSTPKLEDRRNIFNSRPNLSGKMSASLNNIQNSERFPYFQVKEENKSLQNQIYTLRAELLDCRTRERFAHEQLDRQIQEIFDDYLRLQRAEDNFKEQNLLSDKYEKLLKEQEQLKMELMELKDRHNESIRAQSEPSNTFVLSEIEQKYNQRLDELISENKDMRQRNENLSQAVVLYMNQINKMEKEKMAALSSSQLNVSTNFDITDRDRVEKMLKTMKAELVNEHEKNHTLRKKIKQLMGKDCSNLSEKSIEEGTEAELFCGEEDDDEEYNQILKQSEEVCQELRRRGWLDKTERSNEFGDSFMNEPPIDVGSKMKEMLERFGKEASLVVPEAIDHVMLLNSSIGQVLQGSMNATMDINSLKDNLSGFRDLLVNLFERLKGSAKLFDDIRLILSDGEHNPLTEKINEMQLMWNAANETVQNISKAAATAEKSCLALEAHISVLEQSIVQTSFVLDHTRRMTLSSTSFINHLGQFNEANRIDEESKMKIEQLMEEKEKLRLQLSMANEELEIALEDKEHIKKLLEGANEKWEESNAKYEDLILANAEEQKTVQNLLVVRDDLCNKIVTHEIEIAKLQSTIEQKEKELKAGEQQLDEQATSIKELQRDFRAAQLAIREKERDFEDLKQEATEKVHAFEDKLEAAHLEIASLQERINTEAFNMEKDIKTNSTWSPSSRPSPNSSLLFKSTQPQKSVQTDLMSNDISWFEKKISEMKSMKEDLTPSATSSSRVRSVVYKKSEISNEYRDKLYGDITILLHKSADLTQNLKIAADGKKKNYLFDLEQLVEDAREIRGIADKVKGYLIFDKENMPTDVGILISYLQALRKQNKEMFSKLEEFKKKYEEMKHDIGKSKPEILTRIDEEIKNIYSVMENTSISGVVKALRKAQ